MTSMPALQYLPLPVSASAPLPPSRAQTACCLSRSNPPASMKRTPFEAHQHTPTRAAPVSQPIPAFSPPPTLSSSVRRGSPSDSSPVIVCCGQTSSGSSNTSFAAPCSPVSPQPAHDDAPQPTFLLAQPALPKIRRIHIDFDYRKPTPNLNPVEPTPEELLAKDFRFLTHEPRQPLCKPFIWSPFLQSLSLLRLSLRLPLSSIFHINDNIVPDMALTSMVIRAETPRWSRAGVEWHGLYAR